MKVLHTADLHIGNDRFAAPGRPWSRLTDQIRVLDRFVAAAAAREVDLAVIAGDLFDTRHPAPREWAAVTRFLHDLTHVCPVVVVDGNHDGPHAINDDESRTLAPLREMRMDDLHMLLGPSFAHVGGAAVVAVPYPHKRAIGDNARASAMLDEGVTSLAQRARGVFPGRPLIFVSHVTVAGAMLGSERAMRLEDDVSLSPSVIDLFDYAALGHIHRQQQVGDRGWYAGSPMYVDFGEMGQQKGFLLADVSVERPPLVEFVESGERALVEAWWPDVVNVKAGDIVRVHAPAAHAARAVNEMYATGARYAEAVSERDENIVVSERAVALDLSPQDALRRYLTGVLGEAVDVERYLTAAQEVMS